MDSIVAVGFSHLTAVMIAQKKRTVSGLVTRTVEFVRVHPTERYQPYFRLENGKIMYHPALLEDLSKLIENGQCKAIVGSLWSNQHFTKSSFRNPRPFDFMLPDEPGRELDLDAEIISYDLIQKTLLDDINLNLKLIETIREFTDKPIYSLSAPPAIGPVEEITGGTSSIDLDKMVKELGIAPPHLRYKFWRACETVARQLSEEYGAIFVAAPPESIGQDGFRIREYWDTDWVHASPSYGELVLRQIDALIPMNSPAKD